MTINRDEIRFVGSIRIVPSESIDQEDLQTLGVGAFQWRSTSSGYEPLIHWMGFRPNISHRFD
jgi:hypothetical protein